ncbi:hypothetical protein GCM10027417_28110 [Glutamicibacter endophyticus]
MRNYLGLNTASDGSHPPLWHGVSRAKRALAAGVSLVMAIGVFVISSWLLAPATGFASYVPWLFAAGALLLSTLIAERVMVRLMTP